MATGAAIAIGAAMGGWQLYEQKKAQKAQNNIAKQQYELAKKTAIDQEQAQNKANQKEVDVEGLLEANSDVSLPETYLTGNYLSGKKKNTLIKANGMLGGD